MSKKFSLKGEAIVRFRFLLEQDYSLEKAAMLAQQKGAFAKVQMDLVLKQLQLGNDPELYQAINADKSSYGVRFREVFYDQTGRGRSFGEALELALRQTDTQLALSPGGNTSRPESEDAKNTTEVQLAITKTNHPAAKIREHEFETLRTSLLKKINSISDATAWPHFLQCTFVEKLGYVRLVCADEKAAKWLTQNLSKLALWPNASLCIMREKTFKNSKAYCVSFPDSVLDSNKVILGYIQSQNTGIDTAKWKVLSRQLLEDRTTLKLLVLLPEDSDRKIIEAAGYELNYKFSKVKFTKPNLNTSKTCGKVTFSATFPDSVGEKAEDIFKYVESQNEGMDTSEWTTTERKKVIRDGKKEVHLVFKVDSCSAEIIRLAKYEINYKFSKVRLGQESMERSQQRANVLGRQNYNPGRGTTLGKRPFQSA